MKLFQLIIFLACCSIATWLLFKVEDRLLTMEVQIKKNTRLIEYQKVYTQSLEMMYVNGQIKGE